MCNLLSIIWDVDPVLFNLGPVEIRYYGLTWALTFGIGMWFFIKLIKQEGYSDKMFDSIFWYGTLSTIIGARLGHCLFYDFDNCLANPLQILNLRQGGLASHGAAVGLLVGLWLFSRKNKMPYVWSLDRIMVPVAIGGAAVRIGNLMNSEIYGTATDAPWGFIFTRVGETIPKHPTQIYEALCYIAIFFVLIWLYFGRDMARKHPGFMFGVGLIGIFVSRFFIEYIKNPQEEFETSMALHMGQWLSVPFVILGMVMIVLSLRKKLIPEPKHIQQKNKTGKR